MKKFSPQQIQHFTKYFSMKTVSTNLHRQAINRPKDLTKKKNTDSSKIRLTDNEQE